MQYIPQVIRIEYDRIICSCNYLDLEYLQSITQCKKLRFHLSSNPNYWQSCTLTFTHSKLTVFKEPKLKYFPAYIIDSNKVADNVARLFFLLEELALNATDIKLAYIEIAIDFRKDNSIDNFLSKHLVMKYNRNGTNNYKNTDYFGHRKKSKKQIRKYFKEKNNCTRVEPCFKGSYIARHGIKFQSILNFNWTDIIAKTVAFKDLNTKYLKKKVEPELLAKINYKKIPDVLRILKERKINTRRALLPNYYQSIFEQKIKQRYCSNGN